MTQDIASIFGKDGPLARMLGPSYHPRLGQIEMSTRVGEAIENGQHAIIEAGTGIGKSFAYLIPVICGQRQAIISKLNVVVAFTESGSLVRRCRTTWSRTWTRPKTRRLRGRCWPGWRQASRR